MITTTDLGNCMVKWQKHHTQESQEDSPFPAGDHKAAQNPLKVTNNKAKNKQRPPQTVGGT